MRTREDQDDQWLPTRPGSAGGTSGIADDRGAVTAEKAIIAVLVIAFAWAGIHFLGDPMRDQLFRVVFTICERIYATISSVFLR